jgi:hypothetical protein
MESLMTMLDFDSALLLVSASSGLNSSQAHAAFQARSSTARFGHEDVGR